MSTDTFSALLLFYFFRVWPFCIQYSDKLLFLLNKYGKFRQGKILFQVNITLSTLLGFSVLLAIRENFKESKYIVLTFCGLNHASGVDSPTIY